MGKRSIQHRYSFVGLIYWVPIKYCEADSLEYIDPFPPGLMNMWPQYFQYSIIILEPFPERCLDPLKIAASGQGRLLFNTWSEIRR
jgi:hypothetical protein